MVVEMSFFNFTYLDDSDVLVMFIILSRRNIDKYFLTCLPYISYPKSILVKKPVLYLHDLLFVSWVFSVEGKKSGIVLVLDIFERIADFVYFKMT